MLLYNSLENLVIFFLLLNALFYPNFVSAAYLVYALFLTLMSLTKSEAKIKMKMAFSLVIILIALASITTKVVYIVKYKHDSPPEWSPSQIAEIKSFGFYIEESAPFLGSMDWFMTLFFDINEILFVILALLVYRS